MPLSLVFTIAAFLTGIICALVGVVYKMLSGRIDSVEKAHTNLAIALSSIKTDIKWIKDKLRKI